MDGMGVTISSNQIPCRDGCPRPFLRYRVEVEVEDVMYTSISAHTFLSLLDTSWHVPLSLSPLTSWCASRTPSRSQRPCCHSLARCTTALPPCPPRPRPHHSARLAPALLPRWGCGSRPCWRSRTTQAWMSWLRPEPVLLLLLLPQRLGHVCRREWNGLEGVSRFGRSFINPFDRSINSSITVLRHVNGIDRGRC